MAAVQPNEKTTQLGSPPRSHHDPESGASSISLEKDVAIGLVGEHAREIDPEVEARVLRKIDWFLIPAMIVGMSYSHLSKAVINLFRLWTSILRQSYPRLSSALRNDSRLVFECCGYVH